MCLLYFGYKIDTISEYDRFLTGRLFIWRGLPYGYDDFEFYTESSEKHSRGSSLPRTRKLGLVVTAALVLEAIPCNLILKPLVARARPFTVNPAVELLITKPTDFSFPSGHTSASFAVVSALFFRKERLWIPAGILAALIAFSRLYLYVHYPTDVLAGALVGILAGWIAVKGTEAIQVRRHAKI